jgi:D-2-hydroxyacid dehydrogenase (NADP+)
MSSVKVLVLTAIGDELRRKMAALDSRLEVFDGTAVCDLVANFPVEKNDADSRRQFDEWLAQTEILYSFAPPANLIARAPRLKWIHVPYAGVDRFLVPDIIASPVLLTNSRGIHGHQVSEAAFEFLLMLARHARLHLQYQQEKKWQRSMPGLLRGKTLGVLGVGVIGEQVARLGKAFGMRVVALEVRPIGRDLVDEVYPPEQLHEFLGRCDCVVVCLPLTPDTRGLLGEKEFRAMKPAAYFVNVARGPIVNEEALYQALRQGWIAGAGIDVFAAEPLPPGSPLWELPNIIIYPHIAGEREDYHRLAVDLFGKNLQRYLAGRELFNLIDKEKGYNAGPLVLDD